MSKEQRHQLGVKTFDRLFRESEAATAATVDATVGLVQDWRSWGLSKPMTLLYGYESIPMKIPFVVDDEHP